MTHLTIALTDSDRETVIRGLLEAEEYSTKQERPDDALLYAILLGTIISKPRLLVGT